MSTPYWTVAGGPSSRDWDGCGRSNISCPNHYFSCDGGHGAGRLGAVRSRVAQKALAYCGATHRVRSAEWFFEPFGPSDDGARASHFMGRGGHPNRHAVLLESAISAEILRIVLNIHAGVFVYSVFVATGVIWISVRQRGVGANWPPEGAFPPRAG